MWSIAWAQIKIFYCSVWRRAATFIFSAFASPFRHQTAIQRDGGPPRAARRRGGQRSGGEKAMETNRILVSLLSFDATYKYSAFWSCDAVDAIASTSMWRYCQWLKILNFQRLAPFQHCKCSKFQNVFKCSSFRTFKSLICCSSFNMLMFCPDV